MHAALREIGALFDRSPIAILINLIGVAIFVALIIGGWSVAAIFEGPMQ